MKPTFAASGGVLLVALVVIGQANGQVWQSTFDSDADGVEEVYDNNTGKEMIGPAVGGNLQIESWDSYLPDGYNPDKAGRPLGTTVNYNTSFSGRYQFSWSALPSTATEGWEFAGFLGPHGTVFNQTRQVFGSIMRHWVESGEYYLSLDMAVMGWGATDFGYEVGPVVSLGPNPLGQDYDLRIQYDGTEHILKLALREGDGSLVAWHVKDLDTDISNWHNYGPAAFNSEINSIALTHLGWSDYTAYAGGSSVWQVNSLEFYDTAIIPEPAAGTMALFALAVTVCLRRGAKNTVN
jgi:hypothetical protein